MNQMSSNLGGWLPIEPHEIILEGFDGSVKFVVDSVISDEINRRHDALGMTTSVQVDRCDSSPTFEVTAIHAMCGSLSSIYQHVHAFTTGHTSQVTINAVGLECGCTITNSAHGLAYAYPVICRMSWSPTISHGLRRTSAIDYCSSAGQHSICASAFVPA